MNVIAQLLPRGRRSLRWRLRHENPRRLTRAQYLAAEKAQTRAFDADPLAEIPWPHEERRHRPYMPAPRTADETAAMLNHQLVFEANRGR